MESDSQPQSAVSWVKQHSKHKPNIKYVLMTLASCIDEGNACPSHRDLAEMTGYTKPTIQHILGELEKDGTLARLKNGGKQVRGGHTSCYRIAGMTAEIIAPELSSSEGDSSKEGSSHLPSSHLYTSEQGSSELSSSDNAIKHETTLSYTRAAGEKELLDLSVVQDLKDKDSAAVAAGTASPEKPKTPRKPKPEIPQDDTYHRLFRGVAIRSFKIDPDNPAMKALLGKNDCGRIGKIVRWLRQKQISPEKLAEFYAWYKQEYGGISEPKDLSKFQEHYAKFIQLGGKLSVVYSPTTASPSRREIDDAPAPYHQPAAPPERTLPAGEVFDPTLLRNNILERRKRDQELYK